ncbi:response regulator transcription factor [Pectinatus brassicae]|uniref:DNA-binding response OmpR family regulator n=1 Tax=Pectinatus brassicae TaxID=862415 RepID=A0A840UER3_9FIRM|nr:response regulator transcription factor [Pectinatus brassicae]MBB5336211.1 DNA-binding response OmpR family regulator [Pectinatus brassicae]
MKNMLIAEDNEQIATVLGEYARQEDFNVFFAADGLEATEIFNKEKLDIVLLDIMMPHKDGFAVCRDIRKTSNVPVIMITARGEDFERIMGLDIGADDYIVKPFSPAEVMARVRAVLRRLDTSSSDKTHILKYDDMTVDLNSYAVSVKDTDISLTKKEIELLWLLASNYGKVFSRDNLLDSIWGYDYFGDTRTVDSHIKRLRAKLNTKSIYGKMIKTVWGVGYKFEAAENEN